MQTESSPHVVGESEGTINLAVDTKRRGTVRCTMSTTHGRLVLCGGRDSLIPSASGAHALRGSRALVAMGWSYALHTTLEREASSPEIARAHAKAKANLEKAIQWLAPLQLQTKGKTEEAWCSACFQHANHHLLEGRQGLGSTFLCSACGSPTARCAAPQCVHMTNRGTGPKIAPGFCAEHRHDIPSFERTHQRISDLSDYRQFLVFERSNFAKGTKMALEGSIIFAAVWLGGETLGLEEMLGDLLDGAGDASAEALESADIDTDGDLNAEQISPASVAQIDAATKLASEGLAGAAGLEAIVSYLREDSSFRIEKLRDGKGSPVIIAKGWLTQDAGSDAPDIQSILAAFPGLPAYRVHWGARTKRSWWTWTKTLLSPLRLPRILLVKAIFLLRRNPWHAAYLRASQTGTLLAALLARTEGPPAILIGHSLGARLMASCANTLGRFDGGRRLQSVHLLGGAYPANGDWHAMANAVQGHVWNYHSRHDPVLANAYRAAQAGGCPAGLVGVYSAMPRIRNVDVSEEVLLHDQYFIRVRLRDDTKVIARWISTILWALSLEWLRAPRRVARNEKLVNETPRPSETPQAKIFVST